MKTLDHIKTLEQLIDAVIDGLKQIEADDRYIIDGNYWHNERDGKCHVCAAGSLIATQLNPDQGRHSFCPHDYDERTKSILGLIDYIRRFPGFSLKHPRQFGDSFKRICFTSYEALILENALMEIEDIESFFNVNLELWTKFRNRYKELYESY